MRAGASSLRPEVFELKKHWANVALLLIAVLGMVSFGILAVGGEPILRWIPALILSVLVAVIAILGIRLDRTET